MSGGGGGGGLGGFFEDTFSDIGDFGREWGPTGLAYLASPLLAQDIAGSSMFSGEGSSSYAQAPGDFLENPGDYLSDPRNQAELLQFNAALLAGAATAGALSPGAATGLAALNGATAAAPASYAAAAGGVGAGILTQGAGQAMGSGAIDAGRAEQEQAFADAQAAARARAAAIAALPKDPTVEEIQRQRRSRGGRRGTILTAPGQSLGSTGQGKNLLGL